MVQEKITIVTTSDNHYVILLAALIKSIEVTNSSKSSIDIYVIDDNIKDINKRKITSAIKDQNINVIWKDIKSVIDPSVKLPTDKSVFPLNTYARLFIPYIVPKETEKVLYLDVDMILIKDVLELWKTDMSSCMIAGVRDRAPIVSHWMGIINYKELGLDPETKYYNAGLMLLKPKEWRDNNITEKVLSCIKQNISYTHYGDQYGLNVVFANSWFELDPRWNCFADSDITDPFLIHFIVTKPLYTSYSFNKDYKNKFYEYLKLTAWRNYKPQKDTMESFKQLKNKIFRKIVRFFRKSTSNN